MKRIGCGLFALAGIAALAQQADAAVVISSHATRNISCTGGVCQATAASAWLRVTDLTNMLGRESVTIQGNAVAPDIISNATFRWNSTYGLTLAAAGNLAINHVITDSGFGPIALTYNENGTGGVLSFGSKGRLTFPNTSTNLSLNGQAYVLVSNIKTLASYIADNPSGNFALSADYDARNDGTYTHPPISTPFAGNFNGLGNIISRVVVDDENANGQNVGFFAQNETSGTIADINVTNLTVTVSGALYMGGLVAYNQGTISGVSINGTLNASNALAGYCPAVGGLAGVNDGIISYSHAGGSVAADATYCVIGGLVGQDALAAPGEIDHSYATASVTAYAGNMGGLVGQLGFANSSTAVAGSVSNTYATGATTATSTSASAVGGLIGLIQDGSASSSTAEGAVTAGAGDLGGAIGLMYAGAASANASVDGLVGDGGVSASGICACGGAVGEAFNGGDSVADSVSYGTVAGGSGSGIGGFIGDDFTAMGMSNDGWDMTTSGINNASQGAGNIPNDPGITGFN